MISVYAQNNTDFSSIGDCILQPTECKIKEIAGGAFTLELTHPVDSGNRWTYLTPDAVIRAPVPVRETPTFDASYKVLTTSNIKTNKKTNYYQATGSGKILSIDSDRGAILGTFKPGDILYKANPVSSMPGWVHVTLNNITGYTKDILDLTWVTGSTTNDWSKKWQERAKSVLQRTISTQLFRIIQAKMDTAKMTVTVKAHHISYDLMGNLVNELDLSGKEKGRVKRWTVQTVMGSIEENLVTTHAETDSNGNVRNRSEFNFYTNITTPIIGQNYSWMNPINCLLDPDKGAVPLSRGKLVRDNYDFFVLEDELIDRGIYISYGKNLKGVTWTKSTEKVVNRIMPYYTDSQSDKKIFYAGKGTIDNANEPVTSLPFLTHHDCDPSFPIDDPIVPHISTLEVQLDDDTLDDKNDAGKTLNAQQKLFRAARTEFVEKNCDQADLKLEVDFVQLGDTIEYQQYASLQQVYLYDTVHISHSPTGFKSSARVKEYEWDCLLNRYSKLELGDVFEVKGSSIASYQLGSGSVSGSKIAGGAVDSNHLRDLAITTAKIDNAAITTAKIQDAAIVNAKIQNAAITEAKIDVAAIGLALIRDLQADTADIQNLNARRATFAQAIISSLEADEIRANVVKALDIQAGSISAEVLKVLYGEIEDVTIDWARIASLKVGKESVSDLFASNLTVGNLTVQGLDGKLYVLSVENDELLIRKAEDVIDGVSLDVNSLFVTEDDVENAKKDGEDTAASLDLESTRTKIDQLVSGLTNAGQYGGSSNIASEDYVDSIVSSTRTNLEGVVETKTSEVLQTTDKLITRFEKVVGDDENAQKSSSYFRFDADGTMTIGKSDKPVTMRLDNDSLEFVYRNTNTVAEIKTDVDENDVIFSELNITNARIGQVMRIGDLQGIIAPYKVNNNSFQAVNWVLDGKKLKEREGE